jgi:hypothetical protein
MFTVHFDVDKGYPNPYAGSEVTRKNWLLNETAEYNP